MKFVPGHIYKLYLETQSQPETVLLQQGRQLEELTDF